MSPSTVFVRIAPLRRKGESKTPLAPLLGDPGGLAQLLVEALRQSVSRAIRRRFLEAQYHMVGMEKEGPDEKVFQDEKAIKSQQIERLQQLRDAAYDDQRIDAAARLAKRISELTGRNERRFRVWSESAGELSTGQYRVRMLRILKLLVDEPTVLLQEERKVVVGLGPRQTLDRNSRYRTPSYTVESKGKATSSARTILWRQLEFGSGVYSTWEQRRPWRYGSEALGTGVVLRGNRPGAFLRSATGVPYDADAVRFSTSVQNLIQQALRGKD